MDMQNIEEELLEDEVVYESVVLLTKSLTEKLSLFNYPTQHNVNMTTKDATCLSAKIKPKQQRVELEFHVDINSHNYDTSRGEQIAYNVDGQSSNGECYFNSGIMDKKLFVGSKVLDSEYNYALGFMRKGELHVAPIQSIIEMNPGYVHMDKINVSSKKTLNTDETGEEEEAVAVTMRFEGPNAERDRQIRQKSYQFFHQKNASEPWVNLNYHKLGSICSAKECERLRSQAHQEATTIIVPKEDYLKELVPECLRLSGCQTSKDEDAGILLDKPLSDQIRHIMINAHLLTFSMLVEKLPQNVDTASIERLLQQVGVLVQGCWAVKSELLYAENTVSPHTGTSAKQLINARDYILWLFTKKRCLTRQDKLSDIRIPADDFKAIISPLAYKANRSWEFKFPTDNDFLENHPSIQQCQDIKWELRYKKLVKDLEMADHEEEAPRPRTKRLSHSSVSEGDESGTDSGPSGSKDRGRRTHVPKKRTILSPTKPASKARMATLDISPTYLESAPPESLKQELRELLGGTLRHHFCMTLSEIKQCMLEGPLSSITSRTDFETLVDEVLDEYGAQKLKNKWPQNTTPESLYAFAKFGNKLDRYRAALLDLFSTTARTRANLFVKKVEDELRERISEADCRQIFEEYCVYKSGFYYLKGTIALES